MEGQVQIMAEEEDTAVNAQGYRQVCEPFAHVRVEILPSHGHDSLLNDPQTHTIAGTFMRCISGIDKAPRKEPLT